jgi:hypothetical protein
MRFLSILFFFALATISAAQSTLVSTTAKEKTMRIHFLKLEKIQRVSIKSYTKALRFKYFNDKKMVHRSARLKDAVGYSVEKNFLHE